MLQALKYFPRVRYVAICKDEIKKGGQLLILSLIVCQSREISVTKVLQTHVSTVAEIYNIPKHSCFYETK